MPTAAHRRELIRSQRRSDRLLPPVVRRLVAGLDPQPPWLPRRVAAVVAHDLDQDAGVGAVQLVWRPGSARAETFTAGVERVAGTWQESAGGGADSATQDPRRAVGQAGQVGVIEVVTSHGLRSQAHMAARPGLPHHEAPWVGTTQLQVAAEAECLLVGERRVPVPEHGTMLLAWTSPPTTPSARRPVIVALGPDGTELSRLAPEEAIDSYTWGLLGAA
ncbi:hypothetical protein [Actinacidiphila paucisporea]|uniref:Uncharacterized protein n=1 Tax=Actinacidiphila paucisporea TaxID=310782 RepID=A0A1M7GVQ6_9ACTN|nr:hypothetical protein [Actinacidiphila paucisporea]SHM20323.1 hypothetical protein SAMN05216499_10987 [Actinacidiphila paucisporea]